MKYLGVSRSLSEFFSKPRRILRFFLRSLGGTRGPYTQYTENRRFKVELRTPARCTIPCHTIVLEFPQIRYTKVRSEVLTSPYNQVLVDFLNTVQVSKWLKSRKSRYSRDWQRLSRVSEMPKIRRDSRNFRDRDCRDESTIKCDHSKIIYL